MKSVSILITCFNKQHRIARTLESASSQSWSNLEIVVVDNNSDDGSREVVSRFAGSTDRPIRQLQCSPQGAAYARAMAFEHSAGDYVLWLDGDDEIHPEQVALQVDALEQSPDASIAASRRGRGSIGRAAVGHHRDFAFGPLPPDDVLCRLLVNDWSPLHAYLLPRELAAEASSSRSSLFSPAGSAHPPQRRTRSA